MARVSFYTLGCKLNYAETTTLERQFEERSFTIVPFGEPADVTVVNTCSVTSEADRKCRNVIRRALRGNPDTFVVVTGCYAQLRPEEISSIPGVDVVLGAGEKFRLFEIVDEFTKTERTQVHVSCIDDVRDFAQAHSSGGRTRAFLKIQDGCDYSCSFCTIPLARGKSRSQSVDATVAQAQSIAAQGFSEIILSGVNIGLYGQDVDSSLIELLRQLDEIDGIRRYRISSIEPNLLNDEIIEFVATSRKFQPHFHIPLQSGDDFVLGKMRRRYRRDLYAQRVEQIKKLLPHACIGVDVIVGFPAEDEARFENTYGFLRDLPVSYLHTFTYSERPNTVAADHPVTLGTSVPPPVRSHRNRMLRILSQKKEVAFYREHLGSVRSVLWEGAEEGQPMCGYTDNYIKVEASPDPRKRGVVEDVRLDELSGRGTVVAAGLDYAMGP